MVPIIACSIIALAIIIERFWTLQRERVMPPHLVAQIWQWEQAAELTIARVRALRSSSPLGASWRPACSTGRVPTRS